MLIKIWTSTTPETPEGGPYTAIDMVNCDGAYSLGDKTHYGEVILIAPPIFPFLDEGDQNVIVRFDPASENTRPVESVYKPQQVHNVQFSSILVDQGTQLDKVYSIDARHNLTIEDVSSLITTDTFSVWKNDAFLTRRTAESLEGIRYAIAQHEFITEDRLDTRLPHTNEVISMASACLALIRPTRRSRAGIVGGSVKADGLLDPRGFGANERADVPGIQKIFTVRVQDIELLRSIFPEFLKLYEKDDGGRLKDEFEPIRMAAQLYGEAYAIHYWKARHILWWSAIEALYGNVEDAVIARIYALFGSKDMLAGYQHSIYETADIPSYYQLSSSNDHTLGEIVPLLYDVRNASAHGRKVKDPHFVLVSHPLGRALPQLEILAEAITFIIRKTIIEILKRGVGECFKDVNSREKFWHYEYGLDKRQSAKRLADLKSKLAALPGAEVIQSMK